VTRFDFNAASQVTQAGYIGVRGSTLFNFASRGYGWATTAGEFDNGGPTPLLRDGHMGTSNTFSIRVVPGALYQVTLSFRDVVNRNGINVYAEGALRSSFRLTGASRLTDLVPGGYDATVTVRFDVVSADGILNLRFTGAGTNPTFIVNGLQLAKR
jgi:hypothetical protein